MSAEVSKSYIKPDQKSLDSGLDVSSNWWVSCDVQSKMSALHKVVTYSDDFLQVKNKQSTLIWWEDRKMAKHPPVMAGVFQFASIC